MNSNKKRILFLLFSVIAVNIGAQELRVTLDPNTKLIDRDKPEGISTVVFDSKVKGLTISVNSSHELIQTSDNYFVFRIDTKEDITNYDYCSRIFTLRSPKSAIHRETLDIKPSTMYYYTVVLPELYPMNLTAEYLITKSAMCGTRVSFGKRFGFFLSYKWGEYLKAGTDIGTVTKDYDVTKAEELGYIRTAITGGVRIGVLHEEYISIYALIGGGYGEYGRQWQNPLEVEGNIYFHSDYFKGFNGDISCQVVLSDLICLSLGTDILMGGGKISIDYQIGAGVNLNLDKLLKRKLK